MKPLDLGLNISDRTRQVIEAMGPVYSPWDQLGIAREQPEDINIL
jgi:hypothetical protein